MEVQLILHSKFPNLEFYSCDLWHAYSNAMHDNVYHKISPKQSHRIHLIIIYFKLPDTCRSTYKSPNLYTYIYHRLFDYKLS